MKMLIDNNNILIIYLYILLFLYTFIFKNKIKGIILNVETKLPFSLFDQFPYYGS